MVIMYLYFIYFYQTNQNQLTTTWGHSFKGLAKNFHIKLSKLKSYISEVIFWIGLHSFY